MNYANVLGLIVDNTTLLVFIMFFSLVVIALSISCYVSFCIFVNKFHLLKKGCKTKKSWVPFLNIYVLGEMLFSEMFGAFYSTLSFGYVLLMIFGSNVVYDSGFSVIFDIFSRLYYYSFMAFVIYAIVKYVNLKSEYKKLGDGNEKHF